jgi:hypothetical protein
MGLTKSTEVLAVEGDTSAAVAVSHQPEPRSIPRETSLITRWPD